jgi:hypothetical protein
MISFPRLVLNVSLMNLCFLTPAIPQTKAPGKPPASTPGIKIERRTPEDGMAITRYYDIRSGRMVAVKAGTEPATARQWLASLVEMKEDGEAACLPIMSKMISTNMPLGLLAVALPVNGTQLSVFSGTLPGGKENIQINARDIRYGDSVDVDGRASQQDALAWLEAVKKTTSEAEYLPLLNANRAKGLTGVGSVSNGIRVETLWQMK